jgi:predicted negative regulator of RcsB-dependent stress response
VFNFLIGLFAGIACAALFGWMNYGSEEREALRDESAVLKALNQEVSSNLKEAQDSTYKVRPLAQPAKPVGNGSSRSSRSTKESEYSR